MSEIEKLKDDLEEMRKTIRQLCFVVGFEAGLLSVILACIFLGIW